MSLKSTETNDYSWIISAILESPFCSSCCCQASFPSIVRPMNRLWEWILKIFCYSPEMNRSIFFSMYFLWKTKKMNHFLRNFVLRDRIFPWFKINPSPAFRKNDSWWRASRFLPLWFCFRLRSVHQIFWHPVVTLDLRADLQEFLCRCCSNPSQICEIHEKFWPTSQYCLCSKR